MRHHNVVPLVLGSAGVVASLGLMIWLALRYMDGLAFPHGLVAAILISLWTRFRVYHAPTSVEKLVLGSRVLLMGCAGLLVASVLHPLYVEVIVKLKGDPEFRSTWMWEYVEPLAAKASGYVAHYCIGFVIAMGIVWVGSRLVPGLAFPLRRNQIHEACYQRATSGLSICERQEFDLKLLHEARSFKAQQRRSHGSHWFIRHLA